MATRVVCVHLEMGGAVFRLREVRRAHGLDYFREPHGQCLIEWAHHAANTGEESRAAAEPTF